MGPWSEIGPLCITAIQIIGDVPLLTDVHPVKILIFGIIQRKHIFEHD